jgi:hypothetical protein
MSGFNAKRIGNTSQTKYVIGLGRNRCAVASVTREYNYLTRTSQTPFCSLFDFNCPSNAIITVPSAPIITSSTPFSTSIEVNFTQFSDGGSPILNYQYSLNSGSSWIPFSPSVTTSPASITGLTSGETYNINIRAVNAIGRSIASNTITQTTFLDAPVITGITGSSQALSVAFTQTTGGITIINYQYSTDNGATFRELATPDVTSPLTITTLSNDGTTLLTNGVTYNVIIQAKTANGLSSLSNMVQGTPSVPPPSTPTSLSSVGGNEEAYILFTQIGTITNYEYSTDNGATFRAFNPPQIYSPVNITTLSSDGVTPLTNGTTYTVKLKAVNMGVSSSESLSVSVTPIITSLETAGRLIYLDANNASSYSGSGTTWTNLESGGAYSATLNGSPTFDNTTEPGKKYFEFNLGAATGQFAQINQAAAINPVVNAPFTIQIWVRINNIGSQGSLVSKMFGSPQDFDGYNFIYTADTALQLHLNGSSRDNRFKSITGVLSSGWTLYTANIQFGNGGGRQNKIFVNGRQVLTATSLETGIPNPTQNLTFPAGFGGDGECDIGEFYYYNTELTTTQIIQNFDASKPRYI